ncbi:MAG: penicillin-insensitive murein endopeptidase [Deltaproteobacteria bacterium]|nr:penicillin-insensitive murein endopeptidase [Deltaproteobacteria bacterium]
MPVRACVLFSVLLCACPSKAPDGGDPLAPSGQGPTGATSDDGDVIGDGNGGATGATGKKECTKDSDCPASTVACQVATCGASGVCATKAAVDGATCTLDGEEAKCGAGACVARCGDGLVQSSRGEQCDDGNSVTHDGCRNDCIKEELIGLGFSGGQCEQDSDCAPAGSKCELGVEGGSCVTPCALTCDDRTVPTTPITFCIAKAVYEDRLGHGLAPAITDGVCVSRCDFKLFPHAGCRSGLHCERRVRNGTTTADEVCVPGPWSVGLELSADGAMVTGVKAGGSQPAQPYTQILATTCGGGFGSVPATLVHGLADTILALGTAGTALNWQRLCTRPSDLPNVHDVDTEIAAGRAFRLLTTRDTMHDAFADALYGYPRGHLATDQGPLWTSRVAAVKKGTTYFVYADAATERPSYDPDRGRHFALVEGVEWLPLDGELLPGTDYLPIKIDGSQRKVAQWALPSTIMYIAEMARAYLMAHGQPLGVGDVSLATGGDIAGHASHDVGKDADIYLLTYPQLQGGSLDMENPELWVSQCSQPGGVWNCTYDEQFSGDPENLAVPGHVPAATLLLTLGEYAYDHAGVTQFVQNDVEVLKPLRDRPKDLPFFRDATLTGGSTGWPIHANHAHLRW